MTGPKKDMENPGGLTKALERERNREKRWQNIIKKIM